MMTCCEAQKDFSSYIDNALSPVARAACNAHLEVCPPCRAHLSEMRAVTRGLANLARPVTPPDLTASIHAALVIEQAARRAAQPRPRIRSFADWIAPHLMPYTVGAFVSAILFFSVLAAMRPSIAVLGEIGRAARIAANAPSNSAPFDDTLSDVNQPVSPEDYAASRVPFTVESPSLDPRGALATMHWTLPEGDAGDDDMMIVADVDSNGDATLAEVVQAPRNQAMLEEFEAALRRTPAFVPAALDNRPQTVRVLFVMQKIDVHERSF